MSASSTNIYDRRRAQLQRLIDERYLGQIAKFAVEVGSSRAAVWQFLSPTYNDGRGIGERAARRMEGAVGLPDGWLDQAGAPLPSQGAARSDPVAQLLTEVMSLRAEVAALHAQLTNALAQITRSASAAANTLNTSTTPATGAAASGLPG